MIFRGGEFSTGEMGNFHPPLTAIRADTTRVRAWRGNDPRDCRKVGIHRRMDREAVLSAVPAERKRPVRERAKLEPARVLSKRFSKRIGGHHGNNGTPPIASGAGSERNYQRWKWPNAPFVATCASERWR